MSTQLKLIKRSLGALTATRLKNIKQPISIEEARNNLRRFYGCHKGNYRVYLEKIDKNGEAVVVAEGRRVDGVWKAAPWSEITSEPHPAIAFQFARGSNIVTDIDIDQLTSLSDIYKITNTGFGSGQYDPSFFMNIWLFEVLTEGEDSRVLDAHNELDLYFSDDWLDHEVLYSLYDNNQPVLEKRMGFTNYLLKNRVNVPMYQLNNLDKRYLHWLLLGPLAPYQFIETEKCKAA